MSQSRPLRWGVIGTAKIAKQWLIPAIAAAKNAEVVAVASRDLAKATLFAEQNGIAQAYGSYEELLADNSIDAVYNPLPNHLHVPISVQAIEAGKHVLCEKPLGLNTQDMQPLLQAAALRPDLVVMEAFMYRFHAQWLQAKALIAQGELGEINSVEASFTYFNRDPDNVRNKADIGGGGLMDIGCYCVSAARFIFGREPVRVSASLDMDPQFGVDRHAAGILDFAPGTASFYCSTQSSPSQGVKINGTKGTLLLATPFYANGPAQLLLSDAQGTRTIAVGEFNHYVAQVEAFSAAALAGQPSPTPLADALANQQVVDALFTAGAARAWVDVGA